MIARTDNSLNGLRAAADIFLENGVFIETENLGLKNKTCVLLDDTTVSEIDVRPVDGDAFWAVPLRQ